jgi:hypothetical protein
MCGKSDPSQNKPGRIKLIPPGLFAEWLDFSCWRQLLWVASLAGSGTGEAHDGLTGLQSVLHVGRELREWNASLF